MSSPTDLDLLERPLRGTVAIEASAGTGKTYTIAQLYLRLLLEEMLRVEQILVVTFTNEATHELRQRVRERVVTTLAAFERGTSDDPFVCAVIARRIAAGDRDGAANRLRLALASFDQAAIFTIHGFCQRMLAEQAFECRQPFTAEVGPEPRALAQAAMDDVWRHEVAEASPLWADYLVAVRDSPETLLESLWPWIERPDIDVLPPADPGDVAALESACVQAWTAARAQCERALAEVVPLLTTWPGLSRGKWKPERIAGYGDALRSWLASESPRIAWAVPAELERFSERAIAAAMNRGASPPAHPFFAVCQEAADACAALHEAFQCRRRALRARARATLLSALAARKAAAGVQSYADLLARLARALESPAGPALGATIRARFGAALIDEFQDTDPTQWAIFRRLFADAGTPLVLVGDPKQAIYGFRGADVFTYVAAHASAADRWPLERNWRSDAALIAGVNALFGGSPHPFLLEGISFAAAVPAEPEAPSPLADPGSAEPPLRFWFVPRGPGERTITKGRARERIARAVAAEIARLLAGGVRLDDAPLRGSDVAVLVRSHFEAALMRAALLRLGIACIERSQESVFESPESSELEHVLRAVAEPGNEGLVRAALTTELLGWSGERLAAVADDERAWAAQIERFQGWRDLWRRRGFARMFRELLESAGVPAHLLAFRDGERRLTNLLHLGELVQAHAMERRASLETLVGWMAERRRAARAEAEEYQLRLESDAQLVQLVTIHASKGLEYPVVFCPFLWDGELHVDKNADLLFHDPAANDRARLSLGPAQPDAWVARGQQEALAEAVRLLYVALTRAKHRCTVVWGAMNGAGTSALGWLLHPPARADVDVKSRKKQLEAADDVTLRRGLQRLVEAAPAAVAVAELPAGSGVPLSPPSGDPAVLHPRTLPAQVPDGWRIASFTMLTAGRSDESPDHDGRRAEPPAPLPAEEVLGLRGGARVGSALHEVFERWDFASTDAAALSALVERRLRAHGLDAGFTGAVTRMVRDVLATPLDAAGRVRLDRVAAADRCAELEFTHPLARLQAADVVDLCRRHAFATGPIVEAVDRLRFDPVQGYMRGFIDLVFRADDRWWLLDWKTNWLGGTRDDYRADKLPAVIAREGYWLQYLLYTVVVHRLLASRVPGYDYDRHFGGALYVFVRGVDPACGPASGVYHHRPPRALVEALDARMRPQPAPETARAR